LVSAEISLSTMRDLSNDLIVRFDAVVASSGISTDTKRYRKLRTDFFRNELNKLKLKVAAGDGKATELQVKYEALINHRGSQNCITEFNRREGIFKAIKNINMSLDPSGYDHLGQSDGMETRFGILPKTQALEYNSYVYRKRLRSFLKKEHRANKEKFDIEIKSVKDKLFKFEALAVQRGLAASTREHSLLRLEILGDPNKKVRATRASSDELAAKLESLKINYDSDTPDSDSTSEEESDYDNDSEEESSRMQRLRRKLAAARKATHSPEIDSSPIKPSKSSPKMKTETRAERANRDFNEYFGNTTKLANWQRLCRDLEIEPVPGSIKKCKQVSFFHCLSLNCLNYTNSAIDAGNGDCLDQHL